MRCRLIAVWLPIVVAQRWNSYAAEDEPYDCGQQPFGHVVAISVDGMHASDLHKWIEVSPNGNIAQLLEHGYEYSNAFTSAPSDSFPGTLAQFTGATPMTTGVWYDDAFDWTFYPPGSQCIGSPGAEVLYDETIDYNSSALFSGGINPANLPRRQVRGRCAQVYPHERLRVNTVFEVARQNGLATAYTDKHPAYDIVRGPSGNGLTVGYFPEIAAVPNTVEAVRDYDQLHVDAWLDWLDATTPSHSEGSLTDVPALFGGNFQVLNVAQKTAGYEDDMTNSFTPDIKLAMTFVDDSIGALVRKLKEKELYDDTLIVIASKHGQAPINPAYHRTVDPQLITNLTKVPVAFQTSDDIALIWLNKTQDTIQAATNLNINRTEAAIRAIIYGQNLTASGFGTPLDTSTGVGDPAVPDIIVEPDLGVIYTTNKVKLAEHGGISQEDRHVTCLVSNPRLSKRLFWQRVYTTQVAPTILHALNLDPALLQGVLAEGTQLLPGFM